MLSVVFCTALCAQDFSVYERKQWSDATGNTIPYRLLQPEKITKGEKYPLVVFMHGSGGRGTDNEKPVQNTFGRMLIKPEIRAQYPCFALFPQIPAEMGMPFGGGIWEERDNLIPKISAAGKMVMELIEATIKDYLVDRSRIYVTGQSMGGFGSLAMISLYPDLFAAAAPVCGGQPIGQVKLWAGKVPVWLFHGDADNTVKVDYSRNIVTELDRLGVTNYRYTEYPDVAHDSWVKTYAEPEFMQWLFSQRKITSQHK